MSCCYSLKFPTAVRSLDHGRVAILTGGNSTSLNCAGALAETASRLAEESCTLARLLAASQHDENAVKMALDQLDTLGLLVYCVSSGTRQIMALEPMTSRPAAWQSPTGVRADGANEVENGTLSRYAIIRYDENRIILESPLSHFRGHLRAVEAMTLLFSLADPDNSAASYPECAKSGLTEAERQQCLRLLALGGFLDIDEPVRADGPGRGRAAQEHGWSPHDLLFHSRSRPGAHHYPIGRTYPLRAHQKPSPAVPPPRGQRTPLPEADIASLVRNDRPFSAVLEGRRSRRCHGDRAISLRELGEFLFRCARVIEPIPADPAAGVPYESTKRPYPGGGGAYELEIHLLVHRCQGLASGVYHYAADAHALETVAPSDRRSARLLNEAARATAHRGRPQVLLIITARMHRVTWKYSGMAYATVLKNVGSLYQTMYLVASAMDLACCAVGTGNSAQIADLLQASDIEEPSVGEFIIGTAA